MKKKQKIIAGLSVLIIPLCAKLHSMEGQGVPYAGFVLSFVLGAWILPFFPYAYPVTVALAMAGIQAANVFYGMGRKTPQIDDILSGKRKTPTLTKILLWIYPFDIKSKTYSWVHMGAKGFLICPPCFILWPLGYELAWQYSENVKRVKEPTNLGEYIAAGLSGVCLVIFWVIGVRA